MTPSTTLLLQLTSVSGSLVFMSLATSQSFVCNSLYKNFFTALHVSYHFFRLPTIPLLFLLVSIFYKLLPTTPLVLVTSPIFFLTLCTASSRLYFYKLLPNAPLLIFTSTISVSDILLFLYCCFMSPAFTNYHYRSFTALQVFYPFFCLPTIPALLLHVSNLYKLPLPLLHCFKSLLPLFLDL